LSRQERRVAIRNLFLSVVPRDGSCGFIDASMSNALPLWSSARGAGSPTVVFEAGGGEDSSVWNELEPEARGRYAVRTMLYDRAGLGRSPSSPPPYRIDGEADALRLEIGRASCRERV